MQGRSDKRQDGRTGWMQERTDVVQDGSMDTKDAVSMQDRTHAGQDGGGTVRM